MMSEKYRLIKHNKNLAEICNNKGVGLLFLVDEDCERKLRIIVDLLNNLNDENRELRQSVEYWQKKYEEGTETFQISENDTTFRFNSNQAQLYTIKSVSPNGVVRLGNGHKAQWRMKDVREISQELPPFKDFNRETFHEIRNKIGAKFDKDVLGRIIYNIYQETFRDYI